ncbi:hypothetical protein [Salegentibacter chungangensis]|uniref:3-oxoacyl-ACP synthase n=1 Tax=Salegentibacter chungangensis TaxID=1335724 RepID=A0ABW3NUE4_9FLAO
MAKEFFISDWVHIRSNRILRNNEAVLESPEETGVDGFLKQAYKDLQIGFPKFHKMDRLCKLGILGSEVLIGKDTLSPDTAMVLSNKASSLDTDVNYRKSMESFPSPSLFVYTLPNIVLGEISIRYKLQSENVFFISEKFDASLIQLYGISLLENTKTPEVLCGWIDLHNEEYDVFLCRISEKGQHHFSERNLRKLYLLEND